MSVELIARPLPLLRHGLVEGWHALALWALGLVAVAALYLPLYPSIGGNPAFAEIIRAMPPELTAALGFDDIFTGSGYAQSTVFGLLGFVLLVIAGVGWGAAAIGGDEELGTLELTLAHGVSRAQLLLERFGLIALKLLLLTAIAVGMTAALNGPAGLGLEPIGLVAAGAAMLGIGLLSATAALAVGAVTGRRAPGVAAGAGIAVLGYALQALANQSADLDWLRWGSPYAWAYHRQPLADGFDPVGLTALFGGSAVLLVLALLVFRRRDLGR